MLKSTPPGSVAVGLGGGGGGGGASNSAASSSSNVPILCGVATETRRPSSFCRCSYTSNGAASLEEPLAEDSTDGSIWFVPYTALPSPPPIAAIPQGPAASRRRDRTAVSVTRRYTVHLLVTTVVVDLSVVAVRLRTRAAALASCHCVFGGRRKSGGVGSQHWCTNTRG